MRELESLHRSAGSVHGCALFRGSELLAFVEDVGRHNAIDTLIGWMALHAVAGGFGYAVLRRQTDGKQ